VQPVPPSTRPYVMTRARVRWMGLLATLPLVSITVMFVAFFATFASAAMQRGMRSDEPPMMLLAMFPLQCVVMVTWVGALVLYVLDVFRNPHVPESLRPVWVLLFFFMGMLTVPLYWFLYLWQPLRRARERPVP
jgi:hypothetical protein